MYKISKAKVRGNNLETESDESQPSTKMDLSLLRKPIDTSVTGFDEVLRAYESGTNELKKLLSKECDLIYECKVCRNIFRSLTNFISHKRVYCRTSFSASEHFHFRNNGFMVQDVSTIIQAEQKTNNSPNGTGILPASEDKSKDLSGIVEQLLWKQHQSLNSNVNDFYDQIQTSRRTSAQNQDDVSSTSPSHKKTQTLKLNHVNESGVAVYQSLQTPNDTSNMKDEIIEVHKMLSKSNTVLGPDGKILNLFNSNNAQSDSPALSAEEAEDSLMCQVCNVQFETQKTLKLHLEMKHLPSTYVYQCPSCTQKFSSSAAVIRHLSNDHNKSTRRIRLMRDNIIKKRVRADEVVSKVQGTSKELQKLQLSNGNDSQQVGNSESSKWKGHDLNANGDHDDSYTCPSCLKKFDRKAVYTSHVQICSDIKDREQERLKKRRAKIKASQMSLESEMDNSTVSEQAAPSAQDAPSPPQKEEEPVAANKRKRKRVSKTKNETEVTSSTSKQSVSDQIPPKEDSEDVVDWNLDDEEERKKLEIVKKEIIEDDFKKNIQVVQQPLLSALKVESIESSNQHQEDDEEESGLVIDLKGSEESAFKCPTCDKVFIDDEKLKYHLTYYHSRQKRFKCKMCEYQGYRKKDTMNHINFVHNAGVTLETLSNFIETVSKAVDEEAVAKQNELKKNQLRIKRKMARERQRQKLADAKGESKAAEKIEPAEVAVPLKEEPKAQETKAEEPGEPPEKIQRTTPPLETSYDSQVMDTPQQESNDSKDSEVPRRRESAARACKDPQKTSPSDSDQSTQRPIRNRVKPVRDDFLYDLSDLLKKEADAHREQIFQSSNVTVKRELRKRAMSTHTREMPNINLFDQSIKKSDGDSSFVTPAPPTTSSLSHNDESPKTRDQRNRRMSVFVTSPRQMYPAQPRSPPYKPPDAGTHKNAGSAHRMALTACENNKASMYEPKFLWTVNFEKEFKMVTQQPSAPVLAASLSSSSSLKTMAAPKSSTSAPNLSAASSILQKLKMSSNRGADSKAKSGAASTNSNSLLKSKSAEEKAPRSMTAELCKKFELINVTNINENEYDIPNSEAISLNPGGNNLNDMCVLQECSDSDLDDGDEDDEEEGEDEEVGGYESEPKLLTRSDTKKKPKRGRKSSKRSTEKRKLSTNGQRRMTVMQRLQENKIRKSREQLFQRLINQQQSEENEDEGSVSSPEFDLFNEA